MRSIGLRWTLVPHLQAFVFRRTFRPGSGASSTMSASSLRPSKVLPASAGFSFHCWMTDRLQVLKKQFEYKGHNVSITTTRSWGTWIWTCDIDGQRLNVRSHRRNLMKASALIEATFRARRCIDRLS